MVTFLGNDLIRYNYNGKKRVIVLDGEYSTDNEYEINYLRELKYPEKEADFNSFTEEKLREYADKKKLIYDNSISKEGLILLITGKPQVNSLENKPLSELFELARELGLKPHHKTGAQKLIKIIKEKQDGTILST